MPDDPDSDTDLLCHSVSSKIVSYYGQFTGSGTIDDDEGDDDDDNFNDLAFTSKPKKKRSRGRTSKEKSQPPKKKIATEQKTVFEISDDDEVITVIDVENFDEKDMEAKLSVQRARNAIANGDMDNTESEEAIRLEEEARIEREAALKRKQEEERQAQEKRPRSKAEGIIFKARHGSQVKKVRMRTTDPLVKLLPKFCADYGLDLTNVYMEFDGDEVGAEDTPRSLEIGQDEIVDVFVRGSRT